MSGDELTNIYKKEMEAKRDHLHGLKLLTEKAAKNLIAESEKVKGDSDIKDYFTIKLNSLNAQVQKLRDELENYTFEKLLIQFRAMQIANSNYKTHD